MTVTCFEQAKEALALRIKPLKYGKISDEAAERLRHGQIYVELHAFGSKILVDWRRFNIVFITSSRRHGRKKAWKGGTTGGTFSDYEMGF